MAARAVIQGRVAVVTGANRGIGLALVEALLERGARRVYAGARQPERLGSLVARYGGRVVPLKLDVADEQQVAKAAELAADADLVINNAGVVERSFVGLEDGDWVRAGRQEYEVNVLGTLRMTQAFAPVLARNGGGTLVNISSVAGLVGFPIFLTYAASKAALHSLTQSTRIALQSQGTAVLGVYPGPVDTDMARDVPLDKVSPASAAAAILEGIELGHEEIFPDPLAVEWGAQYAAGPKALEAQVAGADQASAA